MININPNASDKTIKKISYISTIAISAVVMVLAIKPPAFLQDIVMFAISGFAASFTIPIVMGFFWKGGTSMGGLCSMVSGFVTLLVLYSLPNPNPLGFNPLVWALVISSAAMFFVSKVTEQEDPKRLAELFEE